MDLSAWRGDGAGCPVTKLAWNDEQVMHTVSGSLWCRIFGFLFGQSKVYLLNLRITSHQRYGRTKRSGCKIVFLVNADRVFWAYSGVLILFPVGWRRWTFSDVCTAEIVMIVLGWLWTNKEKQEKDSYIIRQGFWRLFCVMSECEHDGLGADERSLGQWSIWWGQQMLGANMVNQENKAI